MERKIEWLAIPTRNRPELLTRCIESHLMNFRGHERIVKLLISDDSDSFESINRNKYVVKSIIKKYGCEIFYQDKDERKHLMSYLTSQFQDFESIIKFALFGSDGDLFTFGSNRNFISLRTSGSNVMSSDDDIICQTWSMKNFDPIGFSIDNTSLPHWFYPSRSQALEALDHQNLDVMRLHESILGMSLSQLNQQRLKTSPAACTTSASNEKLNIGQRDPDGRVVVVSNGVVGDSGYSSSSGLISLSHQNSMDRLLKSEISYRSALNSREIVRQASSLQISEFSGFMSTSFSFESCLLLPPFFPSCRNEDGIFANLLGLFTPKLYLANIPVALMHDPVEVRTYSAPHLQTRFSELVIALLNQSRIEGKSFNGANFYDIGRYFIEVGAMDEGAQFEYLRCVMRNYFLTKIEYLSDLLSARNFSPDYWVTDISLQILYLERAIITKQHFLPDDILETNKTDKKIRKISNWLKLYGGLLKIWPELMLAAEKYYSEPESTANFSIAERFV